MRRGQPCRSDGEVRDSCPAVLHFAHTARDGEPSAHADERSLLPAAVITASTGRVTAGHGVARTSDAPTPGAFPGGSAR